jgi:hypothetical protein
LARWHKIEQITHGVDEQSTPWWVLWETITMTKEQLLQEFRTHSAEDQLDIAEEIYQLAAPALTDEQLAEVHRRSAAVDAG